ncbi:recombinase family protein [Micromonospora zamorensis]|uniref:recombinase family protein n=1 Tax=Micromonospora zamorensis TaxID=709883 RepID=UPI0033EB7EC1
MAAISSDLYARKSSQDSGRSAARQERDWQQDCAAQGITPGRVFVDPDLSASRYAHKERPDYANLLAHIRSGACQMVSLWEASRGSRQLSEWVDFLDLCRDMLVPIRVFSDGGRTYEPWRRGDYKVLVGEGLEAHDESERLSERTRAGTRDAAHRGRPPGPLLYGYRRCYDDRGHYTEMVIVEEKAAVVRQLLRDTLRGVPLETQAKRLNDAGTPTPAGRGVWTGGHILRMLRHPSYRGHRVFKDEIVYRDAWPAIITEDQFTRLEAVLAQPGRSGRRGDGDSRLTYPLSGAVLCGGCRHPMRSGVKKTRYVCARRGCMKVSVLMKDIEPLVEGMIVARLREPDAAAAFHPAPDSAAVVLARRQLAALRGRLAEVHAQAGLPEGPSLAMLVAAERALAPLIEAAEAEVRRLTAPPALQGIDPAALADQWGQTPVAVRRDVVLTLAEVVVSPCGKGGRWTHLRLAESRWRGDKKTWGRLWKSA